MRGLLDLLAWILFYIAMIFFIGCVMLTFAGCAPTTHMTHLRRDGTFAMQDSTKPDNFKERW